MFLFTIWHLNSWPSFLCPTPFSYPEPFLRAVRRRTLAKSITGYHKNMVRKQCPVLELANHMAVRNMDLARAPRVRRALGMRMAPRIRRRFSAVFLLPSYNQKDDTSGIFIQTILKVCGISASHTAKNYQV
jgi:hypothetical protein